MIDYKKDLEEFERLFPYLQQYQELASKHKIRDIFQDNGGKYLELQLRLQLETTGKRQGNDAVDANGKEYEIKTVNVDRPNGFSTHHHLNETIIQKYEKGDWYFAVYRGIELQAIYLMPIKKMEDYYRAWRIILSKPGVSHINNFKIPLADVVTNGESVWQRDEKNPFSLPSSIRGRRVPRPIQLDLIDISCEAVVKSPGDSEEREEN